MHHARTHARTHPHLLEKSDAALELELSLRQGSVDLPQLLHGRRRSSSVVVVTDAVVAAPGLPFALAVATSTAAAAAAATAAAVGGGTTGPAGRFLVREVLVVVAALSFAFYPKRGKCEKQRWWLFSGDARVPAGRTAGSAGTDTSTFAFRLKKPLPPRESSREIRVLLALNAPVSDKAMAPGVPKGRGKCRDFFPVSSNLHLPAFE